LRLFDRSFRKVQPLFAIPEWLTNGGEKFDAHEYISQIKKTGVDCIEFWAKDHHGIAYYDTKVGKRSRIGRDLLNEVCDEARANSISVIAYYSVCWDNYVAEKNPEWAMRDKEQQPIRKYPSKGAYWTWVCLNSPYREYVLKQLREISVYDIVGFWLDILGIPSSPQKGCFCQYCIRKFADEYHAEAPSEAGWQNPTYRKYERFQLRSLFSFLREVRSIKPELMLTYNGSGFLCAPELAMESDWLNAETGSRDAPALVDQSFKARYLRSWGKPYEMATPGGVARWTEWTIKPLNMLRLETAITIAHGGGLTVGETILPDGSLIYDFYRNFERLYAWVGKIERWLVGATSVPNIAILYTMPTHTLAMQNLTAPYHENLPAKLGRLAEDATKNEARSAEPLFEAYGFHRALLEGHFQYDVIHDSKQGLPEGYSTVILPNQWCIMPDLVEELKRFVANGGALIATGRTSIYNEHGEFLEDFALGDIFGVRYLEPSTYPVSFMKIQDDRISRSCPDFPILLKSEALKVRLSERTVMLARLVYPASERSQTRFVFHDHSHPAEPSEFPMITLNRYGKGWCMYIAAPIGKDFHERKDPWLRQILINAVERVAGRLLYSDAPVGVEVTLNRVGKNLVLHLMNHYAERIETANKPVTLRDISIRISQAWLSKKFSEVSKVYTAPDMEPLEWKAEDEWLIIKVPELEIHTLVVLE